MFEVLLRCAYADISRQATHIHVVHIQTGSDVATVVRRSFEEIKAHRPEGI